MSKRKRMWDRRRGRRRRRQRGGGGGRRAGEGGQSRGGEEGGRRRKRRRKSRKRRSKEEKEREEEEEKEREEELNMRRPNTVSSEEVWFWIEVLQVRLVSSEEMWSASLQGSFQRFTQHQRLLLTVSLSGQNIITRSHLPLLDTFTHCQPRRSSADTRGSPAARCLSFHSL